MNHRNRTAQPLLDVAAGDPGVGMPVLVGLPMPRGMLRDDQALHVIDRSDRPCPVAFEPRVHWDDGSVRWALLSLLAREQGEHRIEVPPEVSPEVPPEEASPRSGSDHTVRVEASDERVVLDNGIVRIVLGAGGAGPVHELVAHGRSLLSGPQGLRLCVDAASSEHEQRRTLRITARSPLRVRVRVEGEHRTRRGERKLSYRLDVELWAGWPSVRLDYHFFNLEPNQPHVALKRIALELDLALAGAQRHLLQSVHGLFYLPREVRNPDAVSIVADDTRAAAHVEDAAMLRDEVEYPFYLDPPLVNTGSWLGVTDAVGGVYMTMQDYEPMRPKRLASEGSKLMLEVWPERAGTLELPQGWSRRQSITLALADRGDADRRWVEKALAAPLAEGRAAVSPDWLGHCGVFQQDRLLERGQSARFEKFLRRLMNPISPGTMFDLGDTPDSGYSKTYIPLGLERVPRLPGAPELPRVFTAGGHQSAAPWSLTELYEPVWANNEYDLVHALATEIMRTGRLDLWATLRRTARHNMEVDFLHYSDHRWLHRATPAHSVRHTTTGAYPSHFWTQGLVEFYCLSGDADALEVAEALGDKIIENFSDPELRSVLWGFNREVGWPVLALSSLLDVTGAARFRRMLDEMVDFLVAFDRGSVNKPVNLSGVNPRDSFIRQMLGSFFGFASMIEGVDEYVRITGRSEVERWLVALLADLRDAMEPAQRAGAPADVRSMVTVAMAIGYERTGDETFIRAGMSCIEELLDSAAWRSPLLETKTIAMMHRGLVRFAGHAQRLGLLDVHEYPSLRRTNLENADVPAARSAAGARP